MEAVQPDVSGRFLTLSFPSVFVYVHARVDVFTRTSLSFPFVSPHMKNVNRCHLSSSHLHIYIQVVIIRNYHVSYQLFIVIYSIRFHHYLSIMTCSDLDSVKLPGLFET
jgi:hypothetical protein